MSGSCLRAKRIPARNEAMPLVWWWPISARRIREIDRLRFRLEHGGDRIFATLANDHGHLALVVLIARLATVAAVFLVIGGLRAAAEVAAIDLNHLALAADDTAA